LAEDIKFLPILRRLRDRNPYPHTISRPMLWFIVPALLIIHHKGSEY